MTVARRVVATVLAFQLATGGAIATAFAQAPPVDVVVLKDGSMVRGTIAELRAGVEVTIVTMTGETRKFVMADVSYAGPAAGAPSPKAPAGQEATPREASNGPGAPLPTVKAPALTLRSPQSGITFHVRTGSASGTGATTVTDSQGRVGTGVVALSLSAWTPICTAPCTGTLAAGSYTLGLSQGTGEVVAHESLVRVDGPSTLTGTYDSQKGRRDAGSAVMLGGFLVGSVLLLSGMAKAGKSSGGGSTVITGSVIILGSVLVGVILRSASDSVSIRVAPAAAGALPTSRLLGSVEPGASALPGGSLVASF